MARIEMEYTITEHRSRCVIERSIVHYCELPECEAQHDDPTKKYDMRSTGWLCDARDRQTAEAIVAALKAVGWTGGETPSAHTGSMWTAEQMAKVFRPIGTAEGE